MITNGGRNRAKDFNQKENIEFVSRMWLVRKKHRSREFPQKSRKYKALELHVSLKLSL